MCPRFLRVDLGTGTSVIAAVHAAIGDRLSAETSRDRDAEKVLYAYGHSAAVRRRNHLLI